MDIREVVHTIMQALIITQPALALTREEYELSRATQPEIQLS